MALTARALEHDFALFFERGHNNGAATPEEVVDHYMEFFKLVEANTAPGAPVPPLATTDGVHFDRRPTPEERVALVAYLRKL